MGKTEKTGVSPSNRVRFASIWLLAYGVFDLVVFTFSGLSITFIAALGAACIIAGYGLWLAKRWGLWLAVATAPLTFCVGVVTFLSWTAFVGFVSNLTGLALNLVLIFYAAASVFLIFYLLSNQELFR